MPAYYLSLGDSLAVGVQPNAQGTSRPTSRGYPDQLQALLRDHGRVLSLEKLGCPGESALPGSGTVPKAVALICQWTWACAAPPVGPNAHANTTGYGVIAATFYAVLRGYPRG